MLIRGKWAIILIAPALAIYGLFVVYPTIKGVQLSFTDARAVVGGNFIGFDNYVEFAKSPIATSAFINTIVFTIFVVIVQNLFGLIIAYGLFSIPRIRNFVRGGLLIPAMLAMVAVAYIWEFIYSPLGGPLDSVLDALGLGALKRSWLGDTDTALIAIGFIYIWMFMGYSATIFLSNYLSIPATLFEAAELDGANRWQRFRYIDWRMLAPSITVNITLSTIGALRVFDLPFIMTSGGPVNATETLSLLVYQAGFQRFQFGYGTAIAVVLLVITIIVGIFQSTVLRRREVQL
jgi:raffinose/stachyose/melibiose transport system permease protein